MVTVEFGLTRAGAGETPWYVAAALGGHAKDARRRGPRAGFAAALLAALALASALAACGGGDSQDANEPAGTYRAKVVEASLPAREQVGDTVLMKLGVRNTGTKAIPALTVNVSVGGKQGRSSTLPFGIRDPQPGLAQPDRPVWVLADHYPKFQGSSEPGGAGTSNPKTFAFGELKPGRTASLVWKLSAVRPGRWALTYAIDAGLSGEARAETANGVEPGGTFLARISSARQNREVNGAGEVVPAGGAGAAASRR